MDELCTPGLSMAVIDGFEVAWAGGFGRRKQGEDDLVTADTLFQAASVSKPVFALAVMRLARDGRLDLDADVNAYLTSWRIPERAGWQPHVTLRQLLSHTAGTSVEGFPGYPASGPWPDLTATLLGRPPANTPAVVVERLPGFQTWYSGGGTTIAQQAVVDATGESFPALMHRLILAPVGMTRSTFAQPLPASRAAEAAAGHPWNGVRVRGDWHVYPEMAAAGLWTTAGDLARLVVELVRILRGDASALGLDRAALLEMLQPQVPGVAPESEFRGLGWRCGGHGETLRFGHTGTNEGYSSLLSLAPARGQGAVVLMSSNQGLPLREEILAAVARAYAWPGAAAARTSMPLAADVDYAGTYRDPRGLELRIMREGQALMLEFDRQPPLALAAASRTELFAQALDLRIRFELDAQGRARALTLVHGGMVITATRRGSGDP